MMKTGPASAISSVPPTYSRFELRSGFLRPLLLMFAVALVIQAGLFAFSFLAFDGWEERGKFGDSFGFISAIFSGFALCGVVFSLVIQFRDQARQRREAQLVIEADFDTRRALVGAFEAQTDELRLLREVLESRLAFGRNRKSQ